MDQLLERIHSRVFLVVCMIRNAPEDTDELTQTCLVEIIENLSKYRGEGSLESWAGQVAYRVVMRRVKNCRRRQAVETPVTESLCDFRTNPELTISKSELWDKLNSEMGSIPFIRREALLLHVAYDFTVSEISERTGASANTVKDRLRTAYQELRAIFRKNAYLKKEILEVSSE